MSRKLIFVIGRRYVRWKIKKVSALLFNCVYASAVELSRRIYTKEEVLKALHASGYDSGLKLIYDMADKVRQGLLGRNLDELIEQGRTAWYIYLGSNVEIEVEKKDNVVIARMRDRECPACLGRTYDDVYCESLAGGHEGAQQAVIELLNLPIEVEVKETACRARGDPYCEFTAIYKLKKEAKPT